MADPVIVVPPTRWTEGRHKHIVSYYNTDNVAVITSYVVGGELLEDELLLQGYGWATVRNNFSSWQAVKDNNPTWGTVAQRADEGGYLNGYAEGY